MRPPARGPIRVASASPIVIAKTVVADCRNSRAAKPTMTGFFAESALASALALARPSSAFA
jgi:F0F1-type ATP synthase membrane subunit c/vacuolar-type H+-ATPase subunit K